MKNKNGFTLIELLAVIVILAVIALIATPIIMNVINDSKIGANKDSVYGYINAATYQLFGKNVDSNNVPVTYKIDNTGQLINGSELIKVDFKGTKPSGGAITFNTDGQVGAALLIDDKCYVKYLVEDEVRVLKSASKCDGDISSNLVVNGYGELGDNTNFSKFEYTTDGFKIENAAQSKSFMSDIYMPVDPSIEYTLSIDLKSTNNTSIIYSGLIEEDKNHTVITSTDYMYINNSLTALARDLNNGDTVIYFNNLSNFKDTTLIANLGLIFWNYVDDTGKAYPPLTFSKNNWYDLYESSSINRSTNTITLKKAWDKGLIKKGTEVSQTNSAGYNYGFVDYKTLDSNYVTKTYKIKDININNGIQKYDKFRPTVKYIKYLMYPNYNGISGSTTSFRNLSIRQSNG